MRGLKHSVSSTFYCLFEVAPYVGAWIETRNSILSVEPEEVAPYVGAWIETTGTYFVDVHEQSHLTWVRGLKLFL